MQKSRWKFRRRKSCSLHRKCSERVDFVPVEKNTDIFEIGDLHIRLFFVAPNIIIMSLYIGYLTKELMAQFCVKVEQMEKKN